MSSQRLKNTLSFANLAPGASIVLPHGLRSPSRPLAPDIIFIPNADLAVTASDTASITLMNNGLDPLSGNVLVEAWHTLERTFDGVQNVDLTVKPYIVVSAAAAASASVNPMSPPEAWVRNNIGSEGAESGEMDPQVSQNFIAIRMIRAGSIVGIRSRVINALTAGNLQVRPTINGAQVGPVATIIGAATQDTAVATVPPGANPYAAGDLIGIHYESSDDMAPSGTTLEAWLEVVEEL